MIDIHINRQDCALGYLTFGHELGHNFGAHHNKEQLMADGDWAPYPYGRGHHISEKGKSWNFIYVFAPFYPANGPCSTSTPTLQMKTYIIFLSTMAIHAQN